MSRDTYNIVAIKKGGIFVNQLALLPLLGLMMKPKHQSYRRKERDEKYKRYSSDLYKISFEYPKEWVAHKNYSERYEGENGFFEVAEIKALGRTIEEVAHQEIDTPIKPYGQNPKIEKLTLDGQPARLILPSEDQNKIFEREVGLIVENKAPVKEGIEVYNYTIIWSDRDTIEHIIDTFRFQ